MILNYSNLRIEIKINIPIHKTQYTWYDIIIINIIVSIIFNGY